MRKWQYFLPLTAATICTARVFSTETNYYKAGETFPKSSLAKSILVNTPRDRQPETNHTVSLAKKLNLTREQQQQIEAIRRRYQENILRKKQELESLQQQLAQMLTGNDKVVEIRAKNQEVISLRQEIDRLRFESILATRETLTLEQRQKFQAIIQSRQDN